MSKKKKSKPISVHPKSKKWIRGHYNEYLRSDHWARIKAAWIASGRSMQCYICSSQFDLHFHHRSYQNLGREKLNDLIVLCDRCHYEVHFRLKTRKSKKTTLWNIADKLIRERERKAWSKRTGVHDLVPLI